MSELLALGISHKTAPVALRERLAFTEHEASEFARQATASAEVREAVVISTCNRTEVYLVVGDPVQAEGTLTRLEPISVSVRTRLPVLSAAANRRLENAPVVSARIAASCARLTWPWISASPTIIDSRPAVTR
jgi:glutamyl-tRNA reductase